MISYAPNREDVLLARVLRADSGFYIDIGAGDPANGSLTRHFHERGWHGINVAASPEHRTQLAAARPADATLAPEDAEPLSAACSAHVDGAIDFLAVHGGADPAAVLPGGDWERWRPRIVMVAGTPGEWEKVLLDAGYAQAAYDGINRFYARSEEPDLLGALAVPVNSGDDYLGAAEVELRAELLAVQEAREAEHVAHESLQADYQSLAGELVLLRAQYERLERGLRVTRSAYESVREEIAVARDLADRAQAEVAVAKIQIERVGTLGLAVARRLTAASNKYPVTAKSLKGAMRAGVKVKRSLSKREQ
ncbi:MAG: hypothetical protein ACRDJU_00545 [Actinomycetota bacterium]